MCIALITGCCYSMYIQSPFYGDDEEELFQSICNEQVVYPRWFPADALNFVDKVHMLSLYVYTMSKLVLLL